MLLLNCGEAWRITSWRGSQQFSCQESKYSCGFAEGRKPAMPPGMPPDWQRCPACGRVGVRHGRSLACEVRAWRRCHVSGTADPHACPPTDRHDTPGPSAGPRLPRPVATRLPERLPHAEPAAQTEIALANDSHRGPSGRTRRPSPTRRRPGLETGLAACCRNCLPLQMQLRNCGTAEKHFSGRQRR